MLMTLLVREIQFPCMLLHPTFLLSLLPLLLRPVPPIVPLSAAALPRSALNVASVHSLPYSSNLNVPTSLQNFSLNPVSLRSRVSEQDTFMSPHFGSLPRFPSAVSSNSGLSSSVFVPGSSSHWMEAATSFQQTAHPPFTLMSNTPINNPLDTSSTRRG